MQKRWILKTVKNEEIEKITSKIQIHPIIAKVLIIRGFCKNNELKAFLIPSLNNLFDPFLFHDMKKVVDRLKKVINQNEKILLFGDYDVDGTTSIALFYTFLSKYKNDVKYHIPNRWKEGYGLSKYIIDWAYSKEINVIVAFDCGINAVEEVIYANQLGIEVIIVDHHVPKQDLPPAFAIINPKKPTCSYPFKELPACGLAFKLAEACALDWGEENKLDIYNLLDFVALAIACDIVPLVGENRILAHFGLRKINKMPRLGIGFLLKKASKSGRNNIRDLVFGVGPIINAAGRIGNGKEAVQILLAYNKKIARIQLAHINNKNKIRKGIQKKVLKSAISMIERNNNFHDKETIILYSAEWHIGVLGIIAARISDTYYKPTFIFGKNEGLLVGSSRSIVPINLFETIKSCETDVVEFGGHARAAGIKLKEDKLLIFSEHIENEVKQRLKTLDKYEVLNISAQIDPEDITKSFYYELQKLAPFGPKNRNPIFSMIRVEDTGKAMVVKNDHLKFEIATKKGKISAFAFNQAHKLDWVKKGSFDIAFNISMNTWNGNKELNLNIKDIR